VREAILLSPPEKKGGAFCVPDFKKLKKMKIKCKECLYYEPDYGTWGVFGWSGGGSKGYCCVRT